MPVLASIVFDSTFLACVILAKGARLFRWAFFLAVFGGAFSLSELFIDALKRFDSLRVGAFSVASASKLSLRLDAVRRFLSSRACSALISLVVSACFLSMTIISL